MPNLRKSPWKTRAGEEEDALRERQLRAFAAAAGRQRDHGTGEAAVMTEQPVLPKGLREINRGAV